jgi:hypothetical protein
MSDIFNQLKEIHRGKEMVTVKLSEIKKEMVSRYNANPTSVIPADYCYNRINDGIRFEKHIFEYLGKGYYRFLGEGYPYSGKIYHKPTRSLIEYIAGEWINGKYNLYDEEIPA